MIARLIARKVAERMETPAMPKRKPRKQYPRKHGAGIEYSIGAGAAATEAGL